MERIRKIGKPLLIYTVSLAKTESSQAINYDIALVATFN